MASVGIGVAQSILCFYINVYYSVILAWVLYYLFSSFTTVLPWSTCGNPWNSDNCREHHWSVNSTNATYNWTSSQDASFTNVSDFRAMDPATEYWERKVLAISAGVEFSGSIKWDLALCLLLAWVVVYFCVWKGIKLSGKISYVTVISPYILLVVLLIRGATLPGAGKGIHFYLSPEWSKLGVVKVWVEAGIQVFFSYGVGLGIHTSLASCNSFHHNCLKHHLIFSLANTCTSLLGGFVIFSVLGFMADKYQLSVAHVAGSGPGLAFVAYPEAVAQMPIAPLWSCIFFLLLFFVGIDSQFLQVEAFMVMLGDLLPQEFQRSPRKEICTAVACLIWFCLGLCMVTEGGIYVEQLFEWYAGGRVIMFIVVLECLAISYVYGVNRLQRNLEYMLGYRLFPYFKVCWAAITPLLGGFLFIMDIVLYPEQT
ncbi:sodium- and chloride-dependent creatine transporter 1-like [Liolophura sinensis]|uniref:sodium- and chloride-dependent creatine transporter 1-like n=1 Tax=Liolophura sinensis TaxID=3198878 RepID=UPI0031598623